MTAPSTRLSAALAWLARAQDARPEDRGVSSSYHLAFGWRPSYPETTGYIVNTFLDYARAGGDPSFRQRAREAGEWLLRLQRRSGAFPGGYGQPGSTPRVFNTGMILFGLADLFVETGDARFLEAGRRALQWLTATQERNGSWTNGDAERRPHAYHACVAWGMVVMARRLSPVEAAPHEATARRAADWVLTQQDRDGWFRSNDLIEGLPPITHNIAYTLSGLVELGAALGVTSYLEAAARAATRLRDDLERSGFMAAGYGPGWSRGPAFRCITGEAQMGLVWARLGQITGEPAWRRAAEVAADQAATTQIAADSGNLRRIGPVHGALPGAWPPWGRYLRFAYPNWATKFFADLLMILAGTCK